MAIMTSRMSIPKVHEMSSGRMGSANRALPSGLTPASVRRSAGIGFWLGESHWGRGITTAALRALTQHAFGSFDLCRLQAYVFERNAASARVLEKAGYVWEARLRKAATKDGRTFDLLVYAMVRE